jgi:hypothetical protein
LVELYLPDGAELAFRFDYGASWRFELRLERLELQGKESTQITLLESVGKGPSR